MATVELSIAQFIEQFKGTICEQAAKQFVPTFTDRHWHDAEWLQDTLAQRLLDQQHKCTAALAHRLRSAKDAILVGEPGVGKTRIGYAVSLLNHYTRTLIWCPPHLLDKWAEEIRSLRPDAYIVILHSVAHLEALVQYARQSTDPVIAILSREKAKLSYAKRPALVARRHKLNGRLTTTYHCPHCNAPCYDRDGLPVTPDTLSPGELCQTCHVPLHGPNPDGPRRVALGDHICRRYPFFFQLTVIDELHDVETMGSAQTITAANLIGKTKRFLGLTGTLTNGKSTSLFYLLWRLIPELRTVFPHNAISQWIDAFGVWETRYTTVEDARIVSHGTQSKRRVYTSQRERPGISPALIPYLIERCVFIKLRDVGKAMPPYQETLLPMRMNPALQSNYQYLTREGIHLLRHARATKDAHLATTVTQALVHYPDHAMMRDEVITDKHGTTLLTIPAMPADILYPKEQAILDEVRANCRKGERTLLYCSHTASPDMTSRLHTILTEAGFRFVVLKASVKPERRMAWLRTQASSRLDGLITNGKLVETGLDLLEYPNIIWTAHEYRTRVLRQASRRPWRLTSTVPVTVKAALYEDSLQQQAWSLIAQGITAALYTEGDLTDQGLHTYGQTTDLTMELIKSLLDHNHQIMSAEEAFRRMAQAEQDINQGLTSTPDHPLLTQPDSTIPTVPARRQLPLFAA